MTTLFVEGVPASGKSTSVRRLAERFQARAVQEGSPDVGLPWSYADAETTVQRTTPATYLFETWRPLAKERTFVDAKLLQNTALFCMLEEREPLGAIAARILEELPRAGVVHLRPKDPEAHLQTTLAARATEYPEWFAFVLPFFEKRPWCMRRGLRGADAYVGALTVWDHVCADLIPSFDVPFLALEDPARDWDESLARMAAFADAL
ncbi:MAG: hypothetical protein AAGE52_24635 [Myxococcota bacterium]